MSTDLIARLEAQSALLDEWVETRRQIAVLEARSAGLLSDRLELMDADIVDTPMHREVIYRSMVAEFSTAGKIAKGSVEHAFTDAHTLHDFPGLQDAFTAGTVSAAHVREILRASTVVSQAITAGTIDADTLAFFEAGALEFAEQEAPSRTRAHVRELAAALAGLTVTEQHKNAEAERGVSVRPLGDGLAMLQAVLPEHLATAIMDRLTQMGRHQKQHPEDRDPTLPDDNADGETIFGDDTFTRDPFNNNAHDDDAVFDGDAELAAYWEHVDRMLAAGPQIIHIAADPRTLDQIRADLFADLLLGATPTAVQGSGLDNITAHIQVALSASTLLGADDRPGQLDGHGPLHPDTARALAGYATSWTRLFLDPTGFVTQTDTYLPSAGMRRYLKARDQHCRFPGCRMPVHRCETDHTHDYALGGPTSLNNLAHLCKTHHTLKHPAIPDQHRWTARQLPDWTIQWTSPTGRVHTDHPPRRVMFTPSRPDPTEQSGRPENPTDWESIDALAPF